MTKEKEMTPNHDTHHTVCSICGTKNSLSARWKHGKKFYVCIICKEVTKPVHILKETKIRR